MSKGRAAGWVLAVSSLFWPRLFILLFWIFDDQLFSDAFDSWVVPFLGLFLLPWTTLAYATMWGLSSDRVSGRRVGRRRDRAAARRLDLRRDPPALVRLVDDQAHADVAPWARRRGGQRGRHVRGRAAAGELSGLFAAPGWLRDLGVMSWLLVGVAALLIGAIWLLATINTIVIPVVTAGILAAVLSPLVGAAARHMPRGAATAIVFLAVLVAGVAVRSA
jgi:hypothetical protein